MKKQNKDIFKEFLIYEEARIEVEYKRARTRFLRINKLREEFKQIKTMYTKKVNK